MAAETEVAQANPSYVDASVLNYKGKAETNHDFDCKHDAVHCFVGVVVEEGRPNEAHAVKEVSQGADSSHKVVPRRISGCNPVNFVLVSDKEA